jgi:hypothetical protein
MHGSQLVARELFYGSNGTDLFVRLDGAGSGKLGIQFETGAVEARVVRGRIVEIETPRMGDRFRVTVERDGLPPATLPAEGWIEFKRAAAGGSAAR